MARPKKDVLKRQLKGHHVRFPDDIIEVIAEKAEENSVSAALLCELLILDGLERRGWIPSNKQKGRL